MSDMSRMEGRGHRRGSFGSLTAGLIVRCSVPAQVLFGTSPPAVREPAPAREAAPEPVRREPIAPVAPVVEIRPAPVPVAVAAPVRLAPGPVEHRPAACQRKAMTVRLEPSLHLKLRVASAYQRRSGQEIMVQALTSYLDDAGSPDICHAECA
jgi:hypothetical protein